MIDIRNKSVEFYLERILSVELISAWNEDSQVGFVLTWTAKGIGFGELTFYKNPDGILKCDSEAMTPEFVEAVLIKYARSLTLTGK